MKRFLLFLMALLSQTRCFEVIHQENTHVKSAEMDIINDALANDPFFGGMTQVSFMGSGTYGVVIHMKKGQQQDEEHFAIKIGKEKYLIDYPYNTNIEAMLNIDPGLLNTTIRGNRITDYLRHKHVPYVSYVMTYRHIVMGDTEGSGEVVSFVVQAMELAKYGDIGGWNNHLIEENVSTELKLGYSLDLFYKMMLAIKDLSNEGIIHGDLKPENIFIKDSGINDFGSDFDPVIGDWDLAYRYAVDSSSEQIRYTYTFRPPEMCYFYNEESRYFDVGYMGYKYSGTEDIHAMGIVFRALYLYFGTEPPKAMLDLIFSMVSPVTDDEIFELLTNDQGRRDDTYAAIKNGLNKTVPNKEWTDGVKALNDIATILFSQLENLESKLKTGQHGIWNGLVDHIKNQKKKFQEDFYYEILINLVFDQYFDPSSESRDIADLIKLDIIDKEFGDSITEAYRNMDTMNRFAPLIKDRPTFDQILEVIKVLLPSDMQEKPILDKVKEDYERVKQQIEQIGLTNDQLRSHIYVDSSFYDASSKEIWRLTKRFNTVLGAQIPENNVPVAMPTQGIVRSSVFDFCKDIRDWITRIKSNNKDDLDKSFKDGITGLSRKLQQIETKDVSSLISGNKGDDIRRNII